MPLIDYHLKTFFSRIRYNHRLQEGRPDVIAEILETLGCLYSTQG